MIVHWWFMILLIIFSNHELYHSKENFFTRLNQKYKAFLKHHNMHVGWGVTQLNKKIQIPLNKSLINNEFNSFLKNKVKELSKKTDITDDEYYDFFHNIVTYKLIKYGPSAGDWKHNDLHNYIKMSTRNKLHSIQTQLNEDISTIINRHLNNFDNDFTNIFTNKKNAYESDPLYITHQVNEIIYGDNNNIQENVYLTMTPASTKMMMGRLMISYLIVKPDFFKLFFKIETMWSLSIQVAPYYNAMESFQNKRFIYQDSWNICLLWGIKLPEILSLIPSTGNLFMRNYFAMGLVITSNLDICFVMGQVHAFGLKGMGYIRVDAITTVNDLMALTKATIELFHTGKWREWSLFHANMMIKLISCYLVSDSTSWKTENIFLKKQMKKANQQYTKNLIN